MSVLTVDIGNSRIKWGYQDRYDAIEYAACDVSELLNKHWGDLAIPGRILVSDVSAVGEELVEWCLQQWQIEAVCCSPEAAMPSLSFAYADATQLGVDRKLAMLAAYYKLGDCDLCVIDAGTALTMDFINGQGQHQGGYIVPGFATMIRSLQTDTHALDTEQQAVQTLMPGTDTQACISRGCMAMLVDFCHMRIQQHTAGSLLRVVITGGFGPELQPFLTIDSERHDHLVLQGLQIWNEAL